MPRRHAPDLTVAIFSCAVLAGVAQAQMAYRITTIAGTGFVGDGGLATGASLLAVEGLASDPAGNLYVADNAGHRIRKVDLTGKITTVAGNGSPGLRGDGGQAASAVLNAPYGLALDLAGNLYVADLGNRRVRRIRPDGVISTVAGGGTATPGSAGIDALSASLAGPRNVAADRAGNLYIADYAGHRVYRVTPDGRIAIAAGTGVAGYNGDGAGVATQLRLPAGLAVDREGAIYIADSGNRMIRRLAGGQVSTVMKMDTTPLGLAIDRDEALIVADAGANQVLRRAPDSGAVTGLAGVSPALPGPVRDVTANAAGVVCFSQGRQVLKVVPGGAPTVAAGSGAAETKAYESADARFTALESPMGVAFDAAGNIYIAEEASKRVRRVTPGGVIGTVAGGGLATGSSAGDGGPATSARLLGPAAVAWDPAAGLRIADAAGHRVRGVLPSGNIYTVAGDGEPGFRGDSGPATQARLNRPRGIAFDRAGNLYVADSGNHRIRRVGTNGFITTVAGSGAAGYAGDGGVAVRAQLNAPQGVAVDSGGNLYIADAGNHAVRRITSDGMISTLVGTGLNAPGAVAIDAVGALLIADTFNHRIRRFDAAGRIETIAGDGAPGYWGDDGPALAAQLNAPTGLAVNALTGAILVADFDNQRVRLLTPDGVLSPVPPSPPPAEVTTPPPAALTVMNAASLRAGPVASGMIASVFGSQIGPEREAIAELNADGRLPSALDGLDVRFDGVPAPIFFAGPGQINVEVPRIAAPKDGVLVEVRRDGALVASGRVAVVAARPALFATQRGEGQAAVLHEDGTVNSEANPAPRGSIMTLFATGDGATDPPGGNGVPAPSPPARAVLPVSVRVGGADAEVLFAGRAPGLVGVLQINIRLPGLFTPPGVRSLLLTVGGVPSQPGVTIALR